ncbi:MAG: dephospho-CoA kinase [Nitrospirae bacterium]|nr:dephospho-CoA kinase [Nitrospirota bacterium]
MPFIGLTGGIASGKSAIAVIFKSLGAYIIDADVIARELVKHGLPAWQEIVDQFGREILKEDETINRELLGSIIFRSPDKREVLNYILHPKVFEEAERQRIEIEKNDPHAVIIFDVALLIETGHYKLTDKIILAYADEELQIKRLTERNGYTRAEALERIVSQLPAEDKKKYADYIIDTSKPFEEIEQQVAEIFNILKEGSN